MRKILLLFVLAFTMAAQAGTIYVKPASVGGDDTNGNGTSWATAYATPTKAFAAATTSGDIIAIMQGTYTMTSSLATTTKPTNIKIQGGYTGTNDERVVNPSNTVLEYSNGAVRALDTYGSGLVISGLTVQNINFNGYGAFVQMPSGANLKLEDCIVNNIHQTNTGATRGVFRLNVGGLTLSFNRCQINNCSGNDKAVVCNNSTTSNSTVILRNSVINGTTVKPFIDGRYLIVEITNCNFINNNTSGGSATANLATSAVISNSIFYNSTLAGSGSLNYCYYNGAIGSLTPTSSVQFSTVTDVFADATNFYPSATFAGIDTGSNSAVAVEVKDIAGNERITNSTVDIGAYESIPAPITIVGNNITSVGTATSLYYPYGATVQLPVTVSEGSVPDPIEGVLFTGTAPNYTASITVKAPQTITFSATQANFQVTVSTTNVTVISPTLVDGKYNSAASSIIYFTLNEGTENSVATMNGNPLTPVHISGNNYSLTLTGISGATNVDISATLKNYAVNLTKNGYIASVSGLSEGSQTKDYGTAIDLTFTLTAGAHSPYVTVNGAIVSATENAGAYSVPEFTVTDNTNIIISAFAANVLPVAEDTYQRRNGNISGDYVNLTYMESRGEPAGYAAIPLLRFIPTATMKTAGYNKATLKLVPQSTFTVDYTIRQFPTGTYTSINNVLTDDYNTLMTTQAVGTTQNIVNVANVPSSFDVTDNYILNSMPNEIILSVVKASDGTSHRFYSLENGNVSYVPVLAFETVSHDITVNHTGVTITAPTLTGDKFTTTNLSEDITFTVNTDYENPVVTINGTSYTLPEPVAGVYTISLTGIISDKTVDITAPKKVSTLLSNNTENKISVRLIGGRLIISNAKVGANLYILDMTGRKLYEEILKSESSIIDYNLKTGIYLIQTGNATAKIVVR